LYSEESSGLSAAARLWLFLGALNGLIAVAAGAYGRHGALDPGAREMFAIASQYQMAHALALLATAWLTVRSGGRLLTGPNVAGAAFTLGILLFAGSLYWFGVFGLVPMQGTAPAGGWCLMLGWLALMWAAVRGLRGG
jgi:uncharacterized membrane protein YgdD (TMEM256/DUF423 family)